MEVSTRAYPWTYPREDARDLFMDLALAEAASRDAQTIACLLLLGPISRATQSMLASLFADALFEGALALALSLGLAFPFLVPGFRGTMPYLTFLPPSLRTMTGPVYPTSLTDALLISAR